MPSLLYEQHVDVEVCPQSNCHRQFNVNDAKRNDFKVDVNTVDRCKIDFNTEWTNERNVADIGNARRRKKEKGEKEKKKQQSENRRDKNVLLDWFLIAYIHLDKHLFILWRLHFNYYYFVLGNFIDAKCA